MTKQITNIAQFKALPKSRDKIGVYLWPDTNKLASSASGTNCPLSIDIFAEPCTVVGDAFICNGVGGSGVDANQTDLANLAVGDEFTTSDYTIVVTEATGSSTGWTGKGKLIFNFLKIGNNLALQIPISVTFTGIKINQCYQLYSGSVITEYDPSWSSVVDIDRLLSFMNGYVKNFKDLMTIFENTPAKLKVLDQLEYEATELKIEVNSSEDFDTATKNLIETKINEIETLRVQLKSNPNGKLNLQSLEDAPGGIKGAILQKIAELEALFNTGPTVWCRETNRYKETLGDLPNSIYANVTDGIYAHRFIQTMYKEMYGSSVKVEYILKNAGSNGGPGYVDIADESTKEMYEIKSSNGFDQGLIELNSYINKANDPIIGCAIKGWKSGVRPIIPVNWMVCPWNPNKDFKIEQNDRGVITYDIRVRNLPQPNPSPVFVPAALVKKIIDDIIKGIQPSMTLEQVKMVVNRTLINSIPNCQQRKSFAQMAMAGGAIALIPNIYLSVQSGGLAVAAQAEIYLAIAAIEAISLQIILNSNC